MPRLRLAAPLVLSVSALLLAFLSPHSSAQSTDPPNDSDSPVRVNVTLNPDGSRTTYKFDTTNHKATAVTIGSDGKVLGKINYRLDDANRFGTSVSFTADGKFRLKSIYKYDEGGRLAEETQLARDDSIISKIVYHYDANGRQTGYSIYDAAGKLMATQQAPTGPAAPPGSPSRTKK